MVQLHGEGGLSEYQMLRARFDLLERQEIVRQRQAIVYLERRVETLTRIAARVLNLLDEYDDAEAHKMLAEALNQWPSK